MVLDRDTVTQELTALLERAKKSVAHVRLDKVAEVMSMFSNVIELMENNLEQDVNTTDDSRSRHHHKHRRSQKKLQELAISSSDFGYSDSDVGQDKVARPLEKHRTRKSATLDYSSPKLRRRRLTRAHHQNSSRSKHSQHASKKVRESGSFSSESSDVDVSSDEHLRLFTASPHMLPSPSLPVRRRGGSEIMDSSGNESPTGARGSGGRRDSLTVDYSSPSLANRRLCRPSADGGRSSRIADSRGPESVSMTLLDIAKPAYSTSQDKAAPKAAFLRRLDSPESQGGRLEKRRRELASKIKCALELVPNVKLEAYDIIKKKLEHAVKALEKGTTTAKRRHEQEMFEDRT